MAKPWALLLLLTALPAAAGEIRVGNGVACRDDRQCFNRLHPDIPMVAKAKPGETIRFITRNASDADLDPAKAERPLGASAVHPMSGPVAIAGAEPGDVLAVTIVELAPGRFGFTAALPFGFGYDLIGAGGRVLWRLDRQHAVSDDLPGVRIPFRPFPGIVTTLPGSAELAAILAREAALARAGGAVSGPEPANAIPAALCGPDAAAAQSCLRTIPPREHGGNLDIRYIGVGATLYLPCFVAGCGLAIGDVHYAQGDGEVAGTAIEIDAEVVVTTRLLKRKDGVPDLSHGPHYEGPSSLLDIPSRRFYAVTGLPLKSPGEIPPDLAYLEAAKLAPLGNLSKDIGLAARNALAAMVDHIVTTYGYNRTQAYIIASVAVDLRIGQLVDAPNVDVIAILPLDIFVAKE